MQPFESGFVKAAMSVGYDFNTATQLLKYAVDPNTAANQLIAHQPVGLQPTMAGAMAGQGLLLGGLGGAGLGAYNESNKPEKERNYIRAMLGSGALGGGAGMLGGGALGALLGGNQRIL